MRLLRWEAGRGTVDRLIAADELDQVNASEEMAQFLLEAAAKHIDSAELIVALDPAGSYQLSYDGSRKALAAVLQIQGLRPTTKGGHIVIEHCLKAQFVDTGKDMITKFSLMRRLRNDNEYPTSTDNAVTEDEAREQIGDARTVLEQATKLVQIMPVYGK